VILLGDFSFVRIFLKNYRVTMTTTLDTSCSENTMVLSARRGFLHACMYFLVIYFKTEFIIMVLPRKHVTA
jgi:hypothetical protein